MDQRIDSFLGDILALAGAEPDAVREGLRVALAKCEAIFRLQEPNKRMKDKAAHACRALCRASVAEELQRRRGTRIADHLKAWSSTAPSTGPFIPTWKRAATRPRLVILAVVEGAGFGLSLQA